MISHLLTTDEAARCRTVARRWNVGSRFGKLGETVLPVTHNDPFAKHWYFHSEVNKLCTLLKKRRDHGKFPHMETSGFQGRASPSEAGSYSRR